MINRNSVEGYERHSKGTEIRNVRKRKNDNIGNYLQKQ